MTKKKATTDISKKRVVTDAPESNAGDDFHVLWAVRKSVELINLNDDGLKALTLEGTDINDSTEIDPDGDKMLGVDLGEYFGGEDFESAQKVIFSQLKYSTRHSQTPWSIASICQGKKHRHAGSIIHRLAEIYKGYESKFDRKIIRDKLTLKLISNRPFADTSAEVIQKAQEELSKHPDNLNFAKLKAVLDPKIHDDLNKLHTASSLSAGKFTDYLRLLDFSECGVASRSVLKEDVIIAIAQVNGIESSKTYDNLHVKVWNKMMPENRKNNKFTIIDILKTFNFSTVEKLLPVPSKLDQDTVLILRKQSADIVDAILDSESPLICLHAGAGMGKSSILRLIEQKLPKECVTIIFDCYGAGSYLDVIDKRHKPEWALMQICNELAIKTGSPFMMLPPSQPIEVFFREFLDRLKIASKIVQKVQTNAKIVIIIDAADNSITAAEQSSEASFVNEIVKLALPEGCTLLLTTRTHRKESLHLSEKHRSIELKPFTLEETQDRLTTIFPEASSNQTKQFHLLTKGIPRVQTYALANQEAGIETLLEPLKPSGKTVDDLISANLDFVSSKLGNKQLMETIFRYMILLPRPVPLMLLCELASADESVIKDLVIDTAQGVILKDDTLMFTDEDFEDYLRQHYSANQSHHEEIASLLLHRADTDEYASKHIGNFLLLTERYEELKNIVFDKKHLLVPKDPITLKEIAIDRTRQAMKLSLKEKKTVDFLKLQILSAEAAKTNDTLTETLLSNADLTAMYGDRDTVENLYFKSDRLTWYGPVHYRCAAVYSRMPDKINEAKAHLKTAHSWLEWRNREPREERRHYQMDTFDLAFATEAICRLENVEQAMNWLSRRFYHRMDIVTQLLLKNSLDYGSVDEVNKAVTSFKWKLPSRLNIIPVYFSTGEKAPFDTSVLGDELESVFNGRHLLKFRTKQKVVQCAEYLAVNSEKQEQIVKLLKYTSISVPRSFPRFYTSNFKEDKQLIKLDILAKAEALFNAINGTSLSIAQLYPQRFRTADDKKIHVSDYDREEKSRFSDLFGAVLPFYILRAKLLTRKIDETTFFDSFKSHSDSLIQHYRLYSYHRELPHFNAYYAEIFSDITVYLEDKQRYVDLLKSCFCTKENNIPVLLGIANNISRGKTAHTTTLRLLKESDKLIFDAQTDASGKINDFLTCVRVGGKLDHSVGQAYFKKMVETVSEMDVEGFDQIKFIAELSTSSSGSYTETAYMFTRFVEYAHSRLKNWDHFPWDEAINGSAHLDPAGTLALICRWDHLQFIKLKYFILPAARKAFNRKMIEPEMAAALLYLNMGYGDNFSSHCSHLFEGLNTKDILLADAVATEVFRLIRYDCPNYLKAKRVKELRSQLQDGSNLITDIDSFLSFYETKDETAQIQSKSSKKQKIDIPKDLNTNDLTAVKSFIKDTTEEYMGTEMKLEAIRDSCNVSQYIGFLDIILALDDEDIHYYGRKQLLSNTLALWNDHPALDDWKKENFEQFFIKIFPMYLSHDDLLNHPSITEAAKTFGASEVQLSEAVKRILPAYIDTLSAGHIYQLAKFTKYGLSEAEVIELINWTLNRWNEKITATTLGTVWDTKLIIDETQNVTTGLFRYLLGHSEVSYRWQAAHALRSLVRWQHDDVIECLLASQNQTDCIPYQHQNYTYFWISAKLWLWVTLAKIAWEDSSIVCKWASFGIEELRNEQLPHMLIRFFAQEFCSILANTLPETYNKDQHSLINTVLNSSFRKDTKVSETELPVKSKDKLQFSFDSMDTIPYWYAPLNELFNIPYNTVPEMADEVITNDWGYKGKINDDEHVRGDQIDYYTTQNDHGDIPSVETLHKYFEFHAMFVVANKLLNAAQLENVEDWLEWLSGWVTTFDRLWLVDLRDNVPLENLFHEADRSDDWSSSIPTAHPLQFLKFNTDAPVVKGIFNLYYGKDYETIYIESALVSSGKGLSLLRSLASAPKDCFKLPEEGGDRMEVEEPDFELRGWLKWVNGRDKTFDHFDSFANCLPYTYVEPGEILVKQVGAFLSKDHRTTLIDKEPKASYSCWNNTTKYHDHSHLETKGQQYRFDKETLLAFLETSGYELIIECSISRSREYNRYEKEQERPKLTTLYLIHANGTVSTIEGNFKLGQ